MQSEYHKAWKRFKSNRPALAGSLFILFAFFIAFFGYFLVPDDHTNANTQIPELALQPMGSHATLIPVKLLENPPSERFFSILMNGRQPTVRFVPIELSSLQYSTDSLNYHRVGSAQKRESIQRNALSSEGNLYITRHFPLGTDKYGRCIMSRLLLGFRVSLLVGGIAVLISLTIGLALGILGGYFGGRTDDLIMLLINTIWSIPTLLLVFAIVLALGRGISIIFFAVGLTMWVDVARVVRGQAMVLRDLPFVEAARSMGMGHGRILWRHVLPNLLGPVMVVAAGNFATAILVESGLSYLGFGVQPPAPSWGSMLNENYGYALSGKPFLALAPAMAIAITVLAFNLVGNGMRDALDVKN